MNIETREAAVETEQNETSFMRVWKARETDQSAQEVAEYLGCGCTIQAM